MSQDVYYELFHNIIIERPGRLDYVRKAFSMLPALDNPHILDIGCGTLDEFERKVIEQNYSDTIKIINRSMHDLNFPSEHFHIIWSEGSIFIIGFSEGLSQWKKFIKPSGFLVVHDMCWLEPDPPPEILEHWQRVYPGITTVQNNVEKITAAGYSAYDHFALPEEAWGEIYFDPLEARIQQLREKFRHDENARAVLEKEFREIELYRKFKKWYGSAYFIMQKA
ncbi:MAG: class I SAM-dependent methyltransferase [Theionarchaea archaeon]|nr:class I SAM-dependent methyltransferase [Theionarchaea archaeon]